MAQLQIKYKHDVFKKKNIPGVLFTPKRGQVMSTCFAVCQGRILLKPWTPKNPRFPKCHSSPHRGGQMGLWFFWACTGGLFVCVQQQMQKNLTLTAKAQLGALEYKKGHLNAYSQASVCSVSWFRWLTGPFYRRWHWSARRMTPHKNQQGSQVLKKIIAPK